MHANHVEHCADAIARTEPQSGLRMLDRSVGLARSPLENTADLPASSKARIERQRAIDQGYYRADILAEERQREGGVDQHARIIASRLKRPSGLTDPSGDQPPNPCSTHRRRGACSIPQPKQVVKI